MFHKPLKVKSNNQMRSSDRKKMQNLVASQFPTLTEDELELMLPLKAAICVLKVVSHDGTHLTVYTMDKQPMFFKLADREELFPTLYTLWLLPEILPCFTTHPNVLSRMGKCAELLLPEVVRQAAKTETWGRQNDLVAVNLVSNKAPVAIGVLAISCDDMCMSGATGPCVKVMHVFGDKLWGLEPTVCKQVPLLEPVVNISKKDEFPDLVSEKQIHDGLGVVMDEPEPAEKSHEDVMAEQDKILKNAFLAALKLNGANIPVPIIASTFYPIHVQPFLAEPVDIKQTSYKKLQIFFKEMSFEGFLTVREESRGVPKIMCFNLEHPEVLAFDQRLVKYPELSQIGKTMHKKPADLYAVNDATLKLFATFNLAVGATLDPSQIKIHLKDYVVRNNLKLADSLTDQIVLDEILGELCTTEFETVAFNQLIYSVTEKMTSTVEKPQPTKTAKESNKPIIDVTTVKIKWNKVVTMVNNLDHHNVNIAKFVKELKRGVAAGVTVVQPAPDKGPQLHVQGDQVQFVYDLLTTAYGIPGDCIGRQELVAKVTKRRKKKLVNKVKKEMRMRRVKIRKARWIVTLSTAGMRRLETKKPPAKVALQIGGMRKFVAKSRPSERFPFQIGTLFLGFVKRTKKKRKNVVKKVEQTVV